MFSSKYAVGLVILVAVASAGYYLVSKTGNSGTEAAVGNAVPIGATVIYSDDGFSPAVVQVKQGEIVRFINQSPTRKMWVASNPNPTRTEYPAFDQECLFNASEQFVDAAGRYAEEFFALRDRRSCFLFRRLRPGELSF